MNLSGLDLNLLIVLDALLAEASVGRAALRVGLSQPAASHALARLRLMFDDPLLVRTGRGMELTPRALALRAPLRELLDRTGDLFREEGFDPATSRRRFRVMMPDLVVSVIMPALLGRLETTAPMVRIEVTPWRGPAAMTPDFARGIDLVATYVGDAFPGFHRERLYTDSDTLAVRHGHPFAASPPDLPGFLGARHVAIVGRGEGSDPIDRWLADKGVRREVVFTAPSYLQALQIAAATDLVAFVPSRLVGAVGASLGLVAVPPPLDPGVDQQFLYYPVRLQHDPGSAWLREQVKAAVDE